MPDLDGPGTLAALKGMNPRVCCCFMLSRSDSRTAEELLGLGANRVFHKPVGDAELGYLCRTKTGATAGPPPDPGSGAFGDDPENDDLRKWLVALDRAASGVLAGEPAGLVNSEDYRLRAEPCPDHGAACARVTFGALRDHFPWKKTDPRTLARALLQMMLPCGRP
jgi:hypothetical protein